MAAGPDARGEETSRVLWCLAIVAVGVALRLLGLGEWDMWTDEVQTLWVSQSGEFKEGPMYLTAPVNFFLTSWAVAWLGADALGARAVPFLAGSLTVALYFPLMRRWIGGRAALFGTLVLALSFWHVGWSQTARHFALGVLLLLAVLHGFLLYWREGRRGALAASAVLGFAALLTHLSSGFFLAGILAFLGFDWLRSRLGRHEGRRAEDPVRGRRRAWSMAAFGGMFLAYLPIYVWVGSYLLGNKVAWNPPFNILGSLAFYVSPLLALFAVAGIIYLLRERDDLWILLLCVGLLPPVLAATAAAVTISSGAYALPALLPVAALAGVAADRLLADGAQGAGRYGRAALVAALFLMQTYELAHYYLVWNGLKPRWEEATRYVEERRASGERLWADEGDVARYYVGSDWADWFGAYLEPREGESVGAEASRGAWFVLYQDPDRLRSSYIGSPVRLRERIPERARVEAVYPLHYGAKDRTLVVYYLPESAEEAESR